MITPEQHPNFFAVETVIDQQYYVPKVIGVGLWEDLLEAYHAAYLNAKPGETFEQAKYDAWAASPEGNRTIKRAGISILFTPKDGALPIEEVYPFLAPEQIDRAFGFLPRVSTSNTDEPPASIESGASSPDTALTTAS